MEIFDTKNLSTLENSIFLQIKIETNFVYLLERNIIVWKLRRFEKFLIISSTDVDYHTCIILLNAV